MSCGWAWPHLTPSGITALAPGHKSLPGATCAPSAWSSGLKEQFCSRSVRSEYDCSTDRRLCVFILIKIGNFPACSCLRNHQHSHCYLFNCCTTLYFICCFFLLTRRESKFPQQAIKDHPSPAAKQSRAVLNWNEPPHFPPRSRVMEPQYVQCIYYFHPTGLMHELSHYQRDASPRFQWLRPSGNQNIHLCCIYANALAPCMSTIWGLSFLGIIPHPDFGVADVLL